MLGCDTNNHHASRHTITSPTWELRYVSHESIDTAEGQLLRGFLEDGRTRVCMHYHFYDNASVVRSFAEVTNFSDEEQTIDYISSFKFVGMTLKNQQWDKETYLSIPHSGCHGELQWRKNSLYQMGLTKYDMGCTKKLSWSQTGTWSSSEQAPAGVYEDPRAGETYSWQIENNGSWYCEVGHASRDEGLYIQLCGPDYEHNHFLKTLKKGEICMSVPVAFGVAAGGFDEVVDEMTKYRRNIRRKNEDNENLPVIFNDYMNCLFADPTTEKELPLIDAAAEAGAEYFVIDDGWFSELEGGDGAWWSSIGVWKASFWRFPNGWTEVIDYIRSKGMKPGLWIEIEGDEEEAVFNMVNAMLGRVHQSGFLNRLPQANFERVKEGIACYKSIRQDIRSALPKFPLGIIGFDAPWAAAALDCGTHRYLSVWRKDGENTTQDILLIVPEGKHIMAKCIYPKGLPVEYVYDEEKQALRVTLKEKWRARVFKIELIN